jgi:hypothetical protein
LCFSNFFFLGGTGVRTQGLTPGRQALYHFSHSVSPGFSNILMACITFLPQDKKQKTKNKKQKTNNDKKILIVKDISRK